MKNLVVIMCIVFLAKISVGQNTSQNDSIPNVELDNKTYKIIKTDGGSLIGKIISKDAREIFFKTNDGREIYIPQHSISKIVPLEVADFNANGEFIGNDPFATRYFISTNGLPVEKGDSYVLWNWYGPDVQIGLGDNLGVGVITTWIGAPIIGTIKKSWEIEENTQFAVGGLLGTGSYGAFDLYGGMPFASISMGDRKSNFAVSAGYGLISYNSYEYEWDENYNYSESYERVYDGAAMLSLAGMHKFSKNVTFVFESFFMFPEFDDGEYSPVGLVTPGLRFQQEEGKAFQVGFAGLFDEYGMYPLPMLQWYRSF